MNFLPAAVCATTARANDVGGVPITCRARPRRLFPLAMQMTLGIRPGT